MSWVIRRKVLPPSLICSTTKALAPSSGTRARTKSSQCAGSMSPPSAMTWTGSPVQPPTPSSPPPMSTGPASGRGPSASSTTSMLTVRSSVAKGTSHSAAVGSAHSPPQRTKRVPAAGEASARTVPVAFASEKKREQLGPPAETVQASMGTPVGPKLTTAVAPAGPVASTKMPMLSEDAVPHAPMAASPEASSGDAKARGVIIP